MKIYKLQSKKLTEVSENQFKLERDIQRLFEDNLDALMGLTLVRSEFTIKNKLAARRNRIPTIRNATILKPRSLKI
jgi:hypothetical protein